MKNCYTFFICALFVFVLSDGMQAQDERVMIIEPMAAADVIRNFVEADLAATDSATVANTKYILRRDATYPFTEEWRPTYPLHLEAEEGEGKRPIMLSIHPASGQAPSFCRVLNSFEWRGMSFPGLDSDGEHTDNAPFRPRGDGFTSIIDDNLVENQRLDVLRMDGSRQSCFFTNNIMRNGYERNLWNKGGGGLFMRGNKQDTVVWNHNTYFNSTCVVGYQNDGGEGVDYLEFNNNTIVSVGGLQQPGQYGGVERHAAINLGIPQNVSVQNNIFHNVGYMGIDSQFASRHFVFFIKPTDSTQSIVFRNNNIYMDEELWNIPIPDSAVNYRMWNPEMDSLIEVASGETGVSFNFVYQDNISEMLEFKNPASTVEEPKTVKELYWSDPANVIFQTLELDLSKDLYDLDYGYQMEAESFTHGTDGLPLGAKRWHNQTVSNREYESQSDFLVHGNYPNPFTDYTTIRFDLKHAAEVQVIVYDLSGKVVLTVPKQYYAPGSDRQINIHRAHMAAGSYPYRVISKMEAFTVETSKILVVK